MPAPAPAPVPAPATTATVQSDVEFATPSEIAGIAAMLESAFGKGVSIFVEDASSQDAGKLDIEDVDSSDDDELDAFDSYDGDEFFSEDEDD